MEKPGDVVTICRELDPSDSWDEVGRRLLAIDPELFSRLLNKVARYVELFDYRSDTTFNDAVLASILLAASHGCG